jgi:pyridoxamine 5'-phosphate oxidase
MTPPEPATPAPDPNAGLLADDPLPADPFPVLAAWLALAARPGAQREPYAVALATADAAGRPSVRIVLCRGLEPERGAVVFYTNRESRKGRELAARPFAALAFHWDTLGRQVRLEGPVAVVSDAEADAYFATRAAEAQLGAWASPQSAPIAGRCALERAVDAAASRFGVARDPLRPGAVPRPPFWVGYRLVAERAELWVSRRGRLHDRACWTRALPSAGAPAGPWRVERLAP